MAASERTISTQHPQCRTMSDIATTSNAIIKRSVLLSTFPWMTDFLLQKQENLASSDTYTPMLTCLSNFEEELEADGDDNAQGIRRGLVILGSEPFIRMPSKMPKVQRPAQKKIFQLVCLYRLVDVLRFIDLGGKFSGINPRYSRMPEIGVLWSQREWPMSDWVSTLKCAKISLAAYGKQRDTTAATSSHSQEGNLGSKLFRDLHHIAKQNQGTKILFNFQIAAISLHFILLGSKVQHRLSLPDFPQNVQQIEEGGFEKVDKELLAYVATLMNEYEPHKRRYPLYAALLLSPLVLLTDKKLMSRCMEQQTLLKVSKGLGNCKPDALLAVEIGLWKSLLSVAVGQCDGFSAITKFLENLPWESFDKLPAGDLNFFSPDDVAPSQEYTLLSRVNEGEVNEGWLLANLRPGLSSLPSAQDPQPLEPSGTHLSEDSGAASAPHEGARKRALDPDPSEVPSAPTSPRTPPFSLNQESLNQESLNQESSALPSPMDLDTDTSETGLMLRPTGFSHSRSPTPVPQNKGKKRAPAGPSYNRSPPKKRSKRNQVKKNQKQLTDPPSSFQTVKTNGSGSYFDPIEVELIMSERDITFEPKDKPMRERGREVDLFDPVGQVIRWTPEFHFLEDLTGFQNFYNYVKHFYINGRPRHVASPDQSSIVTFSHTEYLGMSVAKVQAILRNKHILITGIPTQSISFDSKGLQTLTNLDARIDVQDQSIDSYDGDFSRQVCTGTLRQLLEASRSESSVILNALSFPLPLSGLLPSAISSEIEAWRLTERMKFCPVEVRFPVGEMRWGLASTRGARSWLHLDSDGLGTYIDVQCGGRWWITVNPHGDTFGSIEAFLNNFDTNGVNQGRWDLNSMGSDEHRDWTAEAVFLSSGTRLIMRPNTPHIVFTTDHSIAHGGHFYASSTMQDTFIAIVHCFMANNLITNSEHMSTRRLLLRMLQYYYKCFVDNVNEDEYSPGHLPDLLDLEAMIDVLTLCNFCILANVLDFRTYQFHGLKESDIPSPRDQDQRIQWDRNGLSWVDREYYVYVRGLALNLIRWISCHYDATSLQSQHPVQSFQRYFCGQYLTDQACAILSYKQKAQEEDIPTLPYCKFKDVERQIDYVFHDDEDPLFSDWKEKRAQFQNSTSLACTSRAFTITKKNPPREFKAMDPGRIGSNQGDKKFREGFANGFRSSQPHMQPDQMDVDTSSSSSSSSSSSGYND